MRIIYRFLFGKPSVDKAISEVYNLVTKSAFKVFCNPKVRNWLEMEELSRQEQDRIFNELVATGLSLALLTTESVIRFQDGDFRQFLQKVKLGLETIHSEKLQTMGVEEELVKQWKVLIEMRMEEFRREYINYRHILPSEEEDNPWIPITSAGAHIHIKRGEGGPWDPFYRFLLKWIIKTENRINGVYVSVMRRI